MLQLPFKSEQQKIKAVVFLINNAERLRDESIVKENYEEAAELQEQIKVLKLELFEIFQADKYTVEMNDDRSITVRKKAF